MCGIVGIFSYRPSAPPVDREELLRIREAMIRRGPDGAGLWLSEDDRVGLAHRRLSIIDLSEAGAQPMASADGRLVVTFNGEIYNYRELRRELEGRGHRFRSQSDTEVLLYLYREYGAEMVHRLRGMYAFAIWDDADRSLFLARDPFGIKPLYYADDGNTLRFASQVKALLKGGQISASPEPAGHVGFFLWGYVPEPYTTHKQIRALSAGCTLRVDRSGVRAPEQFFRITDEFVKARAVSDETPVAQRIERLRAALVDSVRHHLIADVPVGLFLSSGMDSSVLGGVASELVPSALHAVTLGFEEYRGSENDETALAAVVARHYGMAHDVRWYTRGEFDADMQDFLAAMDQPTTDGLNTYLVAKATAESGIKVALSGLGGDELFGGYPSFRDVPRSAKLLAFSRSVPRLGRVFRRITAPLFRHSISPKWAGLFEYGGSPSGAYLLRRGLYMPWELPQFMDPEMVRAGWHELQPLARLDRTIEGLAGSRAVVSALELTWYLRSQLLKDTDWTSMAHSLEVRVPFVDVALFRALAPLIVSVDPPTKRELAHAPGRALPAAIQGRRKTGFSVPLREWHEHMESSGRPERGLRNWARYVIGAWETTREVPPDHSSDRQARVSEPGASSATARRVLIYRLGSLGDTVVALPCFHLIARIFPAAERRVLTNIPVATKASPLSAILGGSGLVHGYMAYPIGLRGIRPLLDLRKRIRAWGPDVLVYLTAPRGRLKTIRDALFFRFCGIRTMLGIPHTNELQRNAYIDDQNLFEHEAARLARCLKPLGDAKLYDSASWDLHLTAKERTTAQEHLDRWSGKERYIACSVGTKISVKDWGRENWQTLFSSLGKRYGSLGLLLVGAAEEFEVSTIVSRAWPGPTLNLCGKLAPRESAAVLARAQVFIGHDSGPMHLAASMGIPCVAIFSARALPGVWYPFGDRHRVIYHRTDCYGCELDVCLHQHKKCILSVTAEEVTQALDDVIASNPVLMQRGNAVAS